MDIKKGDKRKMTIFLTVIFTWFFIGTINFFVVLFKDISGLTKAEEYYITWTVGLGLIWLLIIFPFYRLVKLIKKHIKGIKEK